jgi:endoglucanase
LPDGSTFTVTYQVAVQATFFSLYNPTGWIELAESLAQLSEEQTRAKSAPARASEFLVEWNRRKEEYASIGTALQPCVEARQSGRPLAYPQYADAADKRAPHFGQMRLWLGQPCEFMGVRDQDAFLGPWKLATKTPVMVIGTRYDLATPYEATRPYADLYRNASMLTVEGYGHTVLGLNHADRQLIINSIASKPMARWFGGWSGDIADAVHRFVRDADAADKLPTLVAYNIPGRDACGGHSSGGVAGEAAYKTWIETFAAAIGARPALVVLEPDSIGDLQCIDDALERQARIRMLSFALQAFKDLAPNTWTYVDATNKGWGEYIGIGQVADNLEAVGLQNAHGLAINVSNYYTTAETVTYANQLNSQLAAPKPFVIDTSRNGKGHNGEWCNPADRKLGVTSQTGGGAEMLLWVKVPGDSDGDCGIGAGIPAGTFDPYLAKSLILGDSTP